MPTRPTESGSGEPQPHARGLQELVPLLCRHASSRATTSLGQVRERHSESDDGLDVLHFLTMMLGFRCQCCLSTILFLQRSPLSKPRSTTIHEPCKLWWRLWRPWDTQAWSCMQNVQPQKCHDTDHLIPISAVESTEARSVPTVQHRDRRHVSILDDCMATNTADPAAYLASSCIGSSKADHRADANIAGNLGCVCESKS